MIYGQCNRIPGSKLILDRVKLIHRAHFGSINCGNNISGLDTLFIGIGPFHHLLDSQSTRQIIKNSQLRR